MQNYYKITIQRNTIQSNKSIHVCVNPTLDKVFPVIIIYLFILLIYFILHNQNFVLKNHKFDQWHYEWNVKGYNGQALTTKFIAITTEEKFAFLFIQVTKTCNSSILVHQHGVMYNSILVSCVLNSLSGYFNELFHGSQEVSIILPFRGCCGRPEFSFFKPCCYMLERKLESEKVC